VYIWRRTWRHGFIERFRVEMPPQRADHTHISGCYRAGARGIFFPSSACAYTPTSNETRRFARQGSDATGDAERGYGWEKLISNVLQE